jgi:hypothetical protein
LDLPTFSPSQFWKFTTIAKKDANRKKRILEDEVYKQKRRAVYGSRGKIQYELQEQNARKEKLEEEGLI